MKANWWGLTVGVYSAPFYPKPPAAKFTSKGDSHMRTDAQI